MAFRFAAFGTDCETPKYLFVRRYSVKDGEASETLLKPKDTVGSGRLRRPTAQDRST